MWPFKRKPGRGTTAPKDNRFWNEDWQVGDLALCVLVGTWPWPDLYDPQDGDVLRVSATAEELGSYGSLISVLKFEGKPQNLGWQCIAFRKIRQSHDPAEAEFTALIRAKRPVKA